MSINHVDEAAFEAAKNVDPMLLAGALLHISRTARRSRSQTRRIRWIQRRAELALQGKDPEDEAIELPKSAGPDTHERLAKRLAAAIAVQYRLREALEAIVPMLEEWHMEFPEDVGDLEVPALCAARDALSGSIAMFAPIPTEGV